jgi:DNA-binding response OmpR family regulator
MICNIICCFRLFRILLFDDRGKSWGRKNMRIGVVHADPAQSARLAAALQQAGHEPERFACCRALEQAVQEGRFDLLMMRWDGAELSGVALMHRVRTRLVPAPPVFLLVDNAAPGAIAETADVQLPDPCPSDALIDAVARSAGHRRLNGHLSGGAGQLEFDERTGQVRVHGMPVQLTMKEFALAQLLVRHIGAPLSRAHIMASVWGRAEAPGSRTLDAHIAQVRKRLLLRPDQGWRLSSIYGYGYRLDRIDGVITGSAASATP